jgi:hypothetical protein
MKLPKYKLGGYTFGFSYESIKKRYSRKENFIDDMIKAFPDVDSEKLKKEVLEKVWNEIFPQKGKSKKEEDGGAE